MRREDERRPAPRTPASVLVQREVALLLILSIVSVALYVATRRLADWERNRGQREAAIWYSEGRALLQVGDSEAATPVLRRAVNAERSNTTYMLGLARALADSRHDAEARRLLGQLREVMPDSAEVNYRMARVLARSGEVDTAIRYYYLALYSPVVDDFEDERLEIGFELAAQLLRQGETTEAAGTLTTLARDLPDDAGSHIRVAELFAQAGQGEAALDHYVAAGELDPASAAAASGAGRVALALHNYDGAERHLLRAVELGSEADRDALETATTARRTDPFVRGLSSRARATRLTEGLAWASATLTSCTAADGLPGAASVLPALTAFSAAHDAADLRDADVLAEGAALVVTAATEAAGQCAVTDPTVRAWRTVGERPTEAGS